MKKTKRKAVINLIIFFLLLAGGIYMAIAGVGQNESGKTANVPLGLDLQGGLSVTYEIQDEKPTSDEIKATVDKLQRRVDAYSSEGEVYQEGNDRITVEIPLNTEKVDAHDVLMSLVSRDSFCSLIPRTIQSGSRIRTMVRTMHTKQF